MKIQYRSGYGMERGEDGVGQRHRSRRAEVAAIRDDLTNKGVPLRQLAAVLRSRFRISSRVAYRLAHGLTQQQVATRWNDLWPAGPDETVITHKHVSYWEAWPASTGREPSTLVLNRLARIYQCSAGELLDGEDHSPPVDGAPPSAELVTHAGPTDVVSRVDTFIAAAGSRLVTSDADYQGLVRDLIDWACRMKRRDILHWLSWASAAAAAAPVLAGLDDAERTRVATAMVSPARVDDAVIDHIDAVLWHCMRQDDALGPQAALDTVLAQRRLVGTFLPDAAVSVRNRVLSLYANLSRFAGWLSFDLGNYDAAGEYYEAARSAAHEAQDTALGAFVLCNMSHLATWRGRARIGIDHALAALGWANQTPDPRLRAYAWDVAARAYALDRQDQLARHALDQAASGLQHPNQPDLTHVYFYGPAQLASTESACYLQLCRADLGAEAAARALSGIQPLFVRNRAMASLRLGLCHLRNAKPDVTAGAAAVAEAARLAEGNRSPRITAGLRQGWQALERWHDLPEVRIAREQLTLLGVGSASA